MEGVRLNFWDLGGQEELQSLWDKVSILLQIKNLVHLFYSLATFIINISQI